VERRDIRLPFPTKRKVETPGYVKSLGIVESENGEGFVTDGIKITMNKSG